LPGTPDKETLDRLESSAKLEFRPVLFTDVAASAEAGPSETPAPDDAESDGEAGESETPEPTLNSTPTASPTDASDPSWITEKLFDDFTNFDCDTLDSTGANVA